jgi:hypothetical protein
VLLWTLGGTLKSYVFKVVVEPDEHEDGRETYQAHCPAPPFRRAGKCVFMRRVKAPMDLPCPS